MKRAGHSFSQYCSHFSSLLMTKFFLWLLLSSYTGRANSQFIPNPDKAQLVFYNDHGIVWRTERLLESVNSRGASIVTFYLQKDLSDPAQFLYRDTIGMISRFNPIWLNKYGTLIAWDVFFSYLKNGRVISLDIGSHNIPNSLYYPVLCGVSKSGVLLLTQNEQDKPYFNEAAYFVPWSNDERLLDFTKAECFTDSLGIPFFSTVVKWHDNLILSWRAPTLFCYNLDASALDSFKLMTHAVPGEYDEFSVSQLFFFDGEIALISHYGEKIGFDLRSKKQFAVPENMTSQWIARKGDLVYAVRPSIHPDRTEYVLITYDLKSRTTTDILPFEQSDILEEIELPVFILWPNHLIIWTRHQWKWIKL